MAKRNPANPSGVTRKAKSKKKPQRIQLCIFCGEPSSKTHGPFCGGSPSPDPDQARAAVRLPPPPITQDEPYTNDGKGVVLTNDSITSHVAQLFRAQPFRESAELNELVGWQFSQAVYALRRRGWRIQTLRLAPRRFAYQLLTETNPL